MLGVRFAALGCGDFDGRRGNFRCNLRLRDAAVDGSASATGRPRFGLGYRLGWGIGVQRGYFDYFGGLGVGRGFVRRLLKLRRRFEGWGFQFGVQGYALGFGIEDVCHCCELRDSLLPRLNLPAAGGGSRAAIADQRGVPEAISCLATACL